MWPVCYRGEGERLRSGYINVERWDCLVGWALFVSWRFRGRSWDSVVLLRFDMWRESYRVFPCRSDLDWMFAPRLVRCIVGAFRYAPPDERLGGMELQDRRWCLIDYREAACD